MILRVDQAQFREALQLGLGRAILYARSHNLNEFRDVILDACLTCYSYDIQTEGTRASYMYDLVSCLPDKDFYHERVLKSLKGCGDDWDAVQRFHFAVCLASDGHPDARSAIDENFDPGPRMGEHIGADFIKLDGIAGLLFVADKIGGLLITKPEEVDGGFLMSVSLDTCGEKPTLDALQEAGRTNPRIEKYRLVAEVGRTRTGDGRRAPEVASLTYEQLFNTVPMNAPYLFSKWGEHASDEQLKLAANGLIAAKDSKSQWAHLRIFARRPFPLDVHAVLALVEIEQDRVGFAAVQGLAHVVHAEVRALALRLIETQARLRGEAIALIAENYEPGDHRTVLRWFQDTEDRETRHSFGMDLTKFWKRHPDEETEKLMLLSLYEKGPCSFCRERAVERLLERQCLPDELRAECAWDANTDIRDLVSQKAPQ